MENSSRVRSTNDTYKETNELFGVYELTVARSLILSLTNCALILIPIFNAIGLTPDVTAFIPLFTIACVNMVLVVVPSPALLSDLDATS